MKYLQQIRLFAILPALFLAPIFCFSQINLDVGIEKRSMSKGEYTSYMIDIPQASLKTVEKNWIKLLQDETKEKVSVSEHEMSIKGAIINSITPKPINIYSFIYDIDTAIRIYSFFEIDSVFFTYSGNKDDIIGEKMYNGIANLEKRFAIEQYNIAVKDEFESEQKELSSLQDDLEDLEKYNVSMHKQIKENEQNISESNDELMLLEADNERILGSISSKREEVAKITDKDMEKTAKKELKNLESDRKKIGNKQEKEQKKIVELESDIALQEREIEANLKAQEDVKVKIEDQKILIKSVESKLDGIEVQKANLFDKIFN